MCMSAPKTPAPIVLPKPQTANQRIPGEPVEVDESLNARRGKSKKQRRQQSIARKWKPNAGTVQTGVAAAPAAPVGGGY